MDLRTDNSCNDARATFWHANPPMPRSQYVPDPASATEHSLRAVHGVQIVWKEVDVKGKILRLM